MFDENDYIEELDFISSNTCIDNYGYKAVCIAEQIAIYAKENDLDISIYYIPEYSELNNLILNVIVIPEKLSNNIDVFKKECYQIAEKVNMSNVEFKFVLKEDRYCLDRLVDTYNKVVLLYK